MNHYINRGRWNEWCWPLWWWFVFYIVLHCWWFVRRSAAPGTDWGTGVSNTPRTKPMLTLMRLDFGFKWIRGFWLRNPHKLNEFPFSVVLTHFKVRIESVSLSWNVSIYHLWGSNIWSRLFNSIFAFIAKHFVHSFNLDLIVRTHR